MTGCARARSHDAAAAFHRRSAEVGGAALLRGAVAGAATADPLSALREQAMQRFLRLGLPTPRDETWRYTNLRSSPRRASSMRRAPPRGDLEPTASLSSARASRERVATLLMVNGYPVLPASMDRSVNGIDISSLRDLSRIDPDMLVAPSASRCRTPKRHAGGCSIRRCSSTACISRCTAHVTAAAGHPARRDRRQAAHRIAYPRVIIEAAPGSSATIIEHHVRQGAHTPLSNSATHIALQAGRAARALPRVCDGRRRQPHRFAGIAPGQGQPAAGSSPSPSAAVWCARRSKRSWTSPAPPSTAIRCWWDTRSATSTASTS